MPTLEYIQERMQLLEERHQQFHQTCSHLRHFWDGKMWEDQEAMERSLTQVFRDLRHGSNLDRDPDVKVTLPLIESAVTKFMAFLSSTPQISVMTPPEKYAGLRVEQTRRKLADTVEEFMYGTWETNDVDLHFQNQSWYLPLMGCCFVGAYPDPETKTVRYVTRSPEIAYPVWDWDFQQLQEIGFKWQMPPDVARLRFPNANLDQIQHKGGRRDPDAGHKPVEVIEWYDKTSKTTIVAGQIVQTVTHDLGFVPWVMPEFYHVPDSDFGKGIIEGNAQLFQKLNMLDSLELQAIVENVFARLVLINPAMAPEDIDDGPGAVIPIQQGGDAKWLVPPATTTDLSSSMARSVDFAQRGTHLPGSVYGEGVASSITTGKAQHESMLPTGNIVEYVQSNIGRSWQRLNEMTVEMAEKTFPNTEMTLFGRRFGEGFAGWIQGAKEFSLTLKGKDLKGWSRHQLIFQPTMNIHEKLVMGLQMLGAGLTSKRWVRDQVGIYDSDQMKAEILSEQLEEAWLAGLAQQMIAGQVNPLDVESQYLALDKGSTASLADRITGMPAMAGAMGGMPGAAPGMPPAPGGPAGMGGAGPLPAAPPVGAMGPAPAPDVTAPTEQGQFTLDQAVQDFQLVKKIRGEVWLVGQIVQQGSTDGPIEVAVTESLDKQTLLNGLPSNYHGHLSFHVVEGVPEEAHVDVTPGHDATHGGGPIVDHPDTVAAATGGIEPAGQPGPQSQPPLGSAPADIGALLGG